MNETRAEAVVARALMESYPTWTDEYGTNVEQLTAIAVAALAEHGMLSDEAATLERAPIRESFRDVVPTGGA